MFTKVLARLSQTKLVATVHCVLDGVGWATEEVKHPK